MNNYVVFFSPDVLFPAAGTVFPDTLESIWRAPYTYLGQGSLCSINLPAKLLIPIERCRCKRVILGIKRPVPYTCLYHQHCWYVFHWSTISSGKTQSNFKSLWDRRSRNSCYALHRGSGRCRALPSASVPCQEVQVFKCKQVSLHRALHVSPSKEGVPSMTFT